MAIKQRKQITGTTAQIKSFAGHEGVLAFDKQTKHLHVLSGTAGKTTELANKSDIPAPQDISGKADKTYVDQQLATKEAKGTAYSKEESDGKYSTKAEVTQGLAGKADKTYVDQQLATKEAKGTAYSKEESDGKYSTKAEVTQGLAGKANSSHTHTKSQITDFPAIPDASTLIPKTGDRGSLGGYETTSAVTTINASSPDLMTTDIGESPLDIMVEDGATNQSYTKVVYLTQLVPTILGPKWKWVGGKAPELKAPGIIVFHWNNKGGIANFVAGVA